LGKRSRATVAYIAISPSAIGDDYRGNSNSQAAPPGEPKLGVCFIFHV
jgi:hypothetical protein